MCLDVVHCNVRSYMPSSDKGMWYCRNNAILSFSDIIFGKKFCQRYKIVALDIFIAILCFPICRRVRHPLNEIRISLPSRTYVISKFVVSSRDLGRSVDIQVVSLFEDTTGHR